MSLEAKYSFKAGLSDDGVVLRELLRKTHGLSANVIKRAKRIDDGITVNGEAAHTDRVIRVGDLICVIAQQGGKRSESIPPVCGKLDIIYEDGQMLVINKAGGMPVHPSQNHRYDSVGNIVSYLYKDFVFRPVNRLDKGTSGVMVIAKDPVICKQLSDQFGSTFHKEYIALCEGVFDRPQGSVCAPIGRCGGSVIKREVRDDGKEALTDYEVIKSVGSRTLVRFIPKTGRTHQIRVHAAYIGHPLTGDFLYGVEDKSIISRPALHAHRISLVRGGETVFFEAPLAEDINKLL